MRQLMFTNIAFDDFIEWSSENKKLFDRIVKLLVEVRRTPFEGIGKPELLKHDLKGYWSRRIDKEHRLVYKVTDETILVLSCRDHY